MKMSIQQKYFKFLQESLCSQAEAMSGIMEKYQKLSPRVKGTIGEILMKQAVEPYIPEPYIAGYGEVVSAAKETSGECDLIIYKKPVLLQVGHVTVVPRQSAKVIVQVQTNMGAKNDLKNMKAKCNEQIRFADKLIFVVYAWWLKPETINETKKEIENLGGKLFVLSQAFNKMYPNELHNLVKEIQSVLT